MFFIIILAITVLLNLATIYTGVIGLFTFKTSNCIHQCGFSIV